MTEVTPLFAMQIRCRFTTIGRPLNSKGGPREVSIPIDSGTGFIRIIEAPSGE
jgi:hypothetical protein